MVRLNQPSELVDEVQQVVKKAEHFLSEIKSASNHFLLFQFIQSSHFYFQLSDSISSYSRYTL